MSTKSCIIKYIACLLLMILQTMIMTSLVANITMLRNLFYSYIYTPPILMLIGATIIAVLILVPRIPNIFEVNYIAAMSVIAASSGLAVVTSNVKLWVFLSWLLTVFLAAIAVTLGYLMKRLNEKWFYILNYVIAGLMLVGAFMFVIFYSIYFLDTANTIFSVLMGLSLVVALYLNGQSLKLCDDTMAKSFLPVRLALTTWSLVALLYLSISIAIQLEH